MTARPSARLSKQHAGHLQNEKEYRVVRALKVDQNDERVSEPNNPQINASRAVNH